MLATFLLVVVAWVFFRADSLVAAATYLEGMFSLSLFSAPELRPLQLCVFITIMLGIEWVNRDRPHGLSLVGWRIPVLYRWAGYLAIVYGVILFGAKPQTFIYFQF